MTNDELLGALKRQHVQCAGFESDDLSTDRQTALDYYHQRPNGTEIVGRSTVVSGDVSASVESNLAAMMEAFSSPNVAAFDPVYGDVDAAQLESDAVVDYVMRQGNGRWQLAQAIKETLRLRNGWTKVYCELEKAVTIEDYRNVDEAAYAQLTTRPGIACKVLKYEDGYLKLRCERTYKQFRCEAVAPENIVYPKSYDGCDFEALQRIPYIAERHIEIRDAAIKRGFNEAAVNRIPELRNDPNATAGARNPRKDNALTPGTDKASEQIEWWEIWALVDGERQKVCTDAKFQEVLLKEAHSLVPYSTGQCFIAPHRLTGISLWDKLRQVQDERTALKRARDDNVQATSKNRIAYLDGKVNVDDISDGRVNGAIRVKASVARVSDAVMPLVVPDTSAPIVAAIDALKQERAEMGGASLDMQTGELQMTKQVGSMGLDRAFSVAEQLAAHMTQNVADTLIRSTFLVAHATLREHFTEAIPVKSRGNLVMVTPSQWQPRTQLTVNVGMSPGERTRRAAALDKYLQTHIQLAQLGMSDVLVNLDGFYALLMDWGRVADVPTPERYFIDPRSVESQKARQAKGLAAQQQQAEQKQLVNQAVELEKLKTAFDKYKQDMDAAIEVWAKKVDAKIEYAKLGQEAEIAEANIVGAAAKDMIRGKREREGREESEGKPNSASNAN